MAGFVRLVTPFFSLSCNAAYFHKTIETADKMNDVNRKTEFSKDKKGENVQNTSQGYPLDPFLKISVLQAISYAGRKI